MNVGILTFHWANNYGAQLQAYALCEAIRGLGHQVSVVDYVPPDHSLRWWQGWGIHCGTPSLTLKRLRFDSFRRRFIPLTRRCRTLHELRRITAEFDALITGSDQVWNGNIVKATDVPYFLGFVDGQHCRRISYAACFGDSNQPPQIISVAGPLLRSFDDISVRDEMSAALVQQLSGRDAEIVVDPSLLHDYRELIGKDIDGPDYIAVYFISQDHLNLGRDLIREVRSRLPLPVVTLSQDRGMLDCGRTLLSAGPVEWLSVLRQASFICTDSFHGAAMAIKLRKPFMAWCGLRPERLRSLLSRCGIQNRLIDVVDPATLDELLSTNVDYEAVFGLLSPLINQSRAFLKRALA